MRAVNNRQVALAERYLDHPHWSKRGQTRAAMHELFSCLTIGSQSYTLLSHITGDT